jgi:hypothetical protein
MKTNLNIAWNNTDWSVSNFNKSDRIATTMNFFDNALNPWLPLLLNRARTEAIALAWETGFPDLLLPCLLAEKVDGARNYWKRQQAIRARSIRLPGAAVANRLPVAA